MHKALHRLFEYLDWPYLRDWLEVIVPICQIILILLVALLTIRVAKRLLQTLKRHIKNRSENIEDQKRFETLARVFTYILNLVVWALAIMFALSALGFSIAPMLATAGVAGIAVGFGAQSLVKDYFTGFVMLIENQIRQGDIVDVAGKTGQVEEITLRYVRLRDYEGAVHFIPNSAINLVTNRSRNFAYAVFDLSVAPKTPLDSVYEALRIACFALKQNPDFAPAILGELEIAGVEALESYGVRIKGRIKVTASEQATIRRALLAEINATFATQHIDLAFPPELSN